MAPPDLALVPIGAYEPRPLMAGSHCTPEEGVAIGREFGAKRLCAMHWGTILLTDEPAFEPPGRFRAAALAEGYADGGCLDAGDRGDARSLSHRRNHVASIGRGDALTHHAIVRRDDAVAGRSCSEAP